MSPKVRDQRKNPLWEDDSPIIFPVTYKCNLNCKGCYNKRPRRTDINLRRALAKIRTLPNPWVYITGGEPLLVPEIYEVCDTLRSMGKKVGLTTNGTFKKYAITSHVDRIGVSIDGNKKVNDQWRGKGVYSKAVSFLRQCVKRNQCETVLMTVVYTEDVESINSVISLGDTLGVTYVQVTPDRNQPDLKVDFDHDIRKVVEITHFNDRFPQVRNGSVHSVGANRDEVLCG